MPRKATVCRFIYGRIVTPVPNSFVGNVKNILCRWVRNSAHDAPLCNNRTTRIVSNIDMPPSINDLSTSLIDHMHNIYIHICVCFRRSRGISEGTLGNSNGAGWWWVSSFLDVSWLKKRNICFQIHSNILWKYKKRPLMRWMHLLN